MIFSADTFAAAFEKLATETQAREMMIARNQTIVHQYSAETVRDEMSKIYAQVLRGDN